jgi:hypothetical protein
MRATGNTNRSESKRRNVESCEMLVLGGALWSQEVLVLNLSILLC